MHYHVFRNSWLSNVKTESKFCFRGCRWCLSKKCNTHACNYLNSATTKASTISRSPRDPSIKAIHSVGSMKSINKCESKLCDLPRDNRCCRCCPWKVFDISFINTFAECYSILWLCRRITKCWFYKHSSLGEAIRIARRRISAALDYNCKLLRLGWGYANRLRHSMPTFWQFEWIKKS